MGSQINHLWSLLLYSLEKLASDILSPFFFQVFFVYPFPLSPIQESLMELVIICSTYLCSKKLHHFTLWTISPQLTRKHPITFTCMHKHLPFLWQRVSFPVHMYISFMFNLHCIEKGWPPPTTPPPLSNALTVWGWKPIRPFSSTHERIPVKAPTEENGPCPLIYRLSQEEGLLMHLELTSCVQRPISLLFLFYTILYFSI